MSDKNKTFMIEDAQIIFRNFEGREGQYNAEGQRNFAVIVPPDLEQKLVDDGWSVKYLAAREEDETDTPYIQVSVKFEIRPPRIVMITSTSRVTLDEATVETLDWADIQTADIIARGYDWTVNGKSGTKAYCQSLFVTIQEDALERKYGYYDDAEEAPEE